MWWRTHTILSSSSLLEAEIPEIGIRTLIFYRGTCLSALNSISAYDLSMYGDKTLYTTLTTSVKCLDHLQRELSMSLTLLTPISK